MEEDTDPAPGSVKSKPITLPEQPSNVIFCLETKFRHEAQDWACTAHTLAARSHVSGKNANMMDPVGNNKCTDSDLS